jgi:DNA-binding HxlR family transcriptional regulator
VVVTRSYEQFCGVAHALDLIGERWALLVVRELVLGPKRFTDLRSGLPGIGTSVLAARLRQLEDGGVVQRRTLSPPAASTVYELTEYGRELEPTLLALGRWGARTLAERAPGQTLRSEWLAVALKAFFRPEATDGLKATIELRLGDGTWAARIDEGAVRIAAGAAEHADLVLSTDDETLIGFLTGAPVPHEALAPEGDLRLLERLPAVFRFAPA